MRTLLIESPLANLASISRALRRAGADLETTAQAERVARAEKIVLPGTGSFGAAMSWLQSSGVADAVREALANGAKLLGVCVGFQLLFRSSDEMGTTPGLGLIEGDVRRFETSLPIPQIGWNRVETLPSRLFAGIPSGSYFYFVHSYRAIEVDRLADVAQAEYGEAFTAAVEKGNLFGVQFHPEKSSTAGARVLQNFVELK